MHVFSTPPSWSDNLYLQISRAVLPQTFCLDLKTIRHGIASFYDFHSSVHVEFLQISFCFLLSKSVLLLPMWLIFSEHRSLFATVYVPCLCVDWSKYEQLALVSSACNKNIALN